jgi:hypothetical protein
LSWDSGHTATLGTLRWTVNITHLTSSVVHLKIQSVPRSKHSVSVIKTSQLMLYREIITVCFEVHTKHINTLCGLNVEFVNVKPGGTYCYHWALKGQIFR